MEKKRPGSSGEFRSFFCYFPLCGALEKRRLEGVPVATTPSVYNIKRGSKGSPGLQGASGGSWGLPGPQIFN